MSEESWANLLTHLGRGSYGGGVPKQPDLINSQEAAAILGWNVRRVNRAVVAGQIPVALRVPGYNGANLFRREAIERRAQQGEDVAS